MSHTKPILCGMCQVPVQGPVDPKPDDAVTCPQCGLSDTFENVKLELAQQAKDFVQKKMNATLAKIARRGKNLKFTPSHVQKRSYRFIVHLDG